jgi:hypothetical protein
VALSLATSSLILRRVSAEVFVVSFVLVVLVHLTGGLGSRACWGLAFAWKLNALFGLSGAPAP